MQMFFFLWDWFLYKLQYACSDVSVCVCVQDLKGKILLKGKKIGGLEENLGGVVEDSLGPEMSDDDELAEIEGENHRNNSIRRKNKVNNNNNNYYTLYNYYT